MMETPKLYIPSRTKRMLMPWYKEKGSEGTDDQKYRLLTFWLSEAS
jgi:hypothetical protein